MPTANKAWMTMLFDVYENGHDVSPRGLLVKELLNYSTHVDMRECVTTLRPKLGYKFLVAEAWWILSGRNDVASIQPYSKHISSFSNDGIRFDGAYGPRIIDQIRYVVDTLVGDWQSRQAVMDIWRPNPMKSLDIPCTISLQWMIRGEKLHCFDTMRSSDAWLGWPYDVFNMSMLSAYIALCIRERYGKFGDPESQKFAKLDLGTLHLTAASQHIYVNPKLDGANNIPYSIEDVETVMRTSASESRPYSRLNLGEFSSPAEFLEYLEIAKDGKARDKSWLQEFQEI